MWTGRCHTQPKKGLTGKIHSSLALGADCGTCDITVLFVMLTFHSVLVQGGLQELWLREKVQVEFIALLQLLSLKAFSVLFRMLAAITTLHPEKNINLQVSEQTFPPCLLNRRVNIL